MQREKIKKALRVTGKALACLAIFLLLAAAFFVLVVLPRLDSCAHDEKPFAYDNKMVIEKRTPDGTPYTVNNSTATFRLDVAKPDAHSQLVFANYAAALAYCREHGLPVMPSVQLIQGTLKHFDDQLCAALELAMEARRVQALTLLLDALKREGNEKAIEHVATALALAGVEPDVSAEIKSRVKAGCDAFLLTAEAKPCGFWDGEERLCRIFQSNRFLMAGLSIRESSEACLTLSRTLRGDTTVREAFQHLQAFGTALTSPGPAVPAEEIAGLTPQELAQRYPADARFALISYSGSKEQALINQLNGEGSVRPGVDLMALVIDAVRNGRLRLDPKPDSRWYDYQWYALETLLMPERGRESAKLRLSDAYKKRLENAFATSLAKTRETHIKRLPNMTLGCADGDSDKALQKVQIAPEFAAEPTPTVYLRLARAYCFLRHALVAAMGEEEFARVRVASPDRSAEAALQESAWFCYGLYERLCLEIGRIPDYLPGELSEEDRKRAQASFYRWHDTWRDDPSLGIDARVAAPVGLWPNGLLQYWSSAGVRLEPVVFEYLDEPEVDGEVEPEFAPCAVYLPTDLFLEFTRPGPKSLTRAEFRKLCDGYRDEVTLRKALGAAAASHRPQLGIFVGRFLRANWGWFILAALTLTFWRVRRMRRVLAKGGLVLGLIWIDVLIFSPAYRTVFLVRHIATINEPLGSVCEYNLIRWIPISSRLLALSGLLADSDPQVRYFAARFMVPNSFREDEKTSEAWWSTPLIKERLMRAAKEDDPEIAALAVLCLAQYKEKEVVKSLLAMLPTARPHDWLCECLIHSLEEIGDPRAIEDLAVLAEDSRAEICFQSMHALSKFSEPEAQAHLWRLAESTNRDVRSMAIGVMKGSCVNRWWPALDAKGCREKCDALFLERVKTGAYPFEIRWSLAHGIGKNGRLIEAGSSLLAAAESDANTNSVLTYMAAECLRQQGLADLRCLPAIISNSTMRAELGLAVKEENVESFKQSLAAILSAVTNSPVPEVAHFAERALDELQRESDPRKRRRP